MRIEISHTINIFMPIHNVHCNMNLWEIAKAGNYFKWPLDKIQVVLALRVLTKYDQLSDQLRAFHPIPYHHYFHTQVILSQDLTCLLKTSSSPRILEKYSPRLLYRTNHRRCSVKIGILKNFENFTGKHLWGSIFLIKIQTFRPFEEFLWITAPYLENECSKTILMRKCFIKGTVMKLKKHW